MVLLDMVLQRAPETPVFYLDTGSSVSRDSGSRGAYSAALRQATLGDSLSLDSPAASRYLRKAIACGSTTPIGAVTFAKCSPNASSCAGSVRGLLVFGETRRRPVDARRPWRGTPVLGWPK